jgi:hypothetical protein
MRPKPPYVEVITRFKECAAMGLDEQDVID